MTQNHIKQIRTERNISQQALADILGTSRQNISLYERGDREPKLETWKTLADFFEVSVPYLQGISEKNEWIDETILEISAHIKKILKDPKKFDEEQWLSLDFFVNILTSITEFPGALDKLSLITRDLDQLTDTEAKPGVETPVNQEKLVATFKELLELITPTD